MEDAKEARTQGGVCRAGWPEEHPGDLGAGQGEGPRGSSGPRGAASSVRPGAAGGVGLQVLRLGLEAIFLL